MPQRRVAQAAIRLATAVIKFRNKEMLGHPVKVNVSDVVVGREKLLIGSAVSRTHSILFTHRNKHKSSSLTS